MGAASGQFLAHEEADQIVDGGMREGARHLVSCAALRACDGVSTGPHTPGAELAMNAGPSPAEGCHSPTLPDQYAPDQTFLRLNVRTARRGDCAADGSAGAPLPCSPTQGAVGLTRVSLELPTPTLQGLICAPPAFPSLDLAAACLGQDAQLPGAEPAAAPPHPDASVGSSRPLPPAAASPLPSPSASTFQSSSRCQDSAGDAGRSSSPLENAFSCSLLTESSPAPSPSLGSPRASLAAPVPLPARVRRSRRREQRRWEACSQVLWLGLTAALKRLSQRQVRVPATCFQALGKGFAEGLHEMEHPGALVAAVAPGRVARRARRVPRGRDALRLLEGVDDVTPSPPRPRPNAHPPAPPSVPLLRSMLFPGSEHSFSGSGLPLSDANVPLPDANLPLPSSATPVSSSAAPLSSPSVLPPPAARVVVHGWGGYAPGEVPVPHHSLFAAGEEGVPYPPIPSHVVHLPSRGSEAQLRRPSGFAAEAQELDKSDHSGPDSLTLPPAEPLFWSGRPALQRASRPFSDAGPGLGGPCRR